jgi:hypothetical protein
MEMLRIATSQGADLEKLKQLWELQKEWEANEARKVYLEAFAAFKADAVAIVKNVTVTDGPLKGKKYADLFAVVSAITPALSKHGLSLSWQLTKDEPAWLEVTCTVRHMMGHSESVSMGGPPDTGGAKNAIQARASSKSYLERYTALAITGMAAQGEDKDGNGLGNGWLMEQVEWIENASSVDELKRLYNQAAQAALDNADKNAIAALKQARDRRKAELQ